MEKLQGQLRDTAEGGQRQETEVERAQNSARTAAQQAVNRLEKLAHRKKKVWTGRLESYTGTDGADLDNSSPDIQPEQAGPPNNAEPVRIKTREDSFPVEDHCPDSSRSEPSQIKTKDSCVKSQTVAPAHEPVIESAIQPERQASDSTERGRQRFVRERQEKAAVQRREKRRDPEHTAPARQRNADDTQIRHTPAPSVQDRKQPKGSAVRETASHGNRRIKEARSEANAVGRTSRQAVRGAGSSGKALQAGGHSAQTVRQAAWTAEQARQRAVQAAGAARRTTTTIGKTMAKAAASAMRGAVSGIRALIAPLAAGGGSVIAVVLVLCLVGVLVMSPLGIFFSGGDSGSRQITISAVVREINLEYDTRIEEIKAGVAHDEVSLSGARAPWIEVLAVYAVKTASDPTDGQEVVTMNEEKKALVKQVFWDMNELSSFTSTIPGEDDEGGTTTLYITVT